MTQELAKIVTEYRGKSSMVAKLVAEYRPFFDRVQPLLEEAETLFVADAADLEGQKRSRVIRLALRKERCDIETRRKELKADLLEAGRDIDFAPKKLAEQTEPVEARLERQEKLAEEAEKARKQALLENRSAEIRPFADPSMYRLENLTEEEFQYALQNSKDAAARREADRLAAEAKAATERARAQVRNARMRQLMAVGASLANVDDLADVQDHVFDAWLAEETLAHQKRLEDARKAKEESDRKAREQEAAETERKRREAEAASSKSLQTNQPPTDRAVEALMLSSPFKRELDDLLLEDGAVGDADDNDGMPVVETRPQPRIHTKDDCEKLLTLASILEAIVVPQMVTDAGKYAARDAGHKLNELIEYVRMVAARLDPQNTKTCPVCCGTGDQHGTGDICPACRGTGETK